MQSVVVHGHFYQPPREDPWIEIVEREHSAAPFHDWNARIAQDCYRAVVAARIPAEAGGIGRIANLLEQASFNVGPTLMDWLEREAPSSFRAVLEADRASRQRLGHGNAIATPYHHIILPLASRRDQVTEVRWGIRDFRRRFGRIPEGLWLPETAADEETLDVVAQEGIAFTILAPHQLHPVPLHGLPASVRTSRGRRLAVFTYDGALAHDVAFGSLLRDPAAWAARMILPPDDVRGDKLVALATDGETYGHHHPFGEMALAALLGRVREAGLRVENFASFLTRNPPLDSATLVGPSSWSCAHGLQRWRADCGCRTREGTSQAWREPFRVALDWLKARLDERFEREGARWFDDPWRARDAHDPEGDAEAPVEARELLELQRRALRMFTSCGWFFDDLAGIESLLCLRWAAAALDLVGDEAPALREGLRQRLAAARSNDPLAGTGADLFTSRAAAAYPAAYRVGAGLAAIAAVDPAAVPSACGIYDAVQVRAEQVTVRHRRTGRTTTLATAVQPDAIAQLVVGVTGGGGPQAQLRFPDLPEPVRERLRALGQTKLLGSVCTEAERQALGAGTATLAAVLERAMLRHLGPDAAAADLEALEAALDLLALDSRPVSFDVQTAFYRLARAASPGDRARLLALAPRFGFAPSCRFEEP